MQNLLTVSHLAKSYLSGTEQLKVLTDVSFTLRRGELGVIVGKSGSGKSTILSLIAGLDKPDGGTIVLDGEALHDAAPETLAGIRLNSVGIVFQFFNLLPTLTVAQNVALPGHLRGDDTRELDARVSELLGSLEIGSKAARYPHELSGGETQRVALARALINSPKLILADEPTGNLDAATGKGIIKLFRSLASEHGVSLLIVTHDETLTAVADAVFRLQDGVLR